MAEVINIGGVDYPAYQTVAQIDTYAAGAVGEGADAWRAATDNAKARDGVSATRTLDRQSWVGEKTDPDQLTAWPRTGVTYPDGTPVPDDVIPQQILDADCEIAMDLEAGSALQVDPSTTNTTRRLKAGSVEIEYFRIPGTGTRFPLPVMELIGWFLGGDGAADSESTGTCEPGHFESQFDVIHGY